MSEYINGVVTVRPEKIVEYRHEMAPLLEELCFKVNAAIKLGWQPLGGVFEGGHVRYNQILVQYQDRRNECTC